MKIITSLEKIIRKSLFEPNIISFFINPTYFIRKWIYTWIKNNSKFLKWSILDFGCGQKPYKELFTYQEYIWVDIEKSWHSHVSENIDIYYDWKKIPFEDNSFDATLASEVFEHVFDIDAVVKELHRVLKKEWTILITIPFILWEHEVPYDFWRYTSFGMKNVLERNWFIVEKIDKKWTYIETIFQLINCYFFDLILFFKNNIIKWILSIIFIFPTNLIGTILSAILPNRKNTYLNLIILAKKQ
jgi:SAM-dependent methyltransferase